MKSRSMLCLAATAVAALAVGAVGPAVAAPGGGATVESLQQCETFRDPDTGREIVYCVDIRSVTNETVTPAGVTVLTSRIDSSFSFQQDGVVVNTEAERRRFTFVVQQGSTQVLTLRSDRESFFFGTSCTYEVRLQVVGGQVLIDEGTTVCVAR